MPPSMPVVQNWEHLSFPPVSTEIWLWVQRRSRNQPLELPGSQGWEWGWTPSSPPPGRHWDRHRDAWGYPGMLQGCSRTIPAFGTRPVCLPSPHARMLWGYPRMLGNTLGSSGTPSAVTARGAGASVSPSHLPGCSGTVWGHPRILQSCPSSWAGQQHTQGMLRDHHPQACPSPAHT